MLKLKVGPVEIVVLHSITKRSVQNMLVNTWVQVSIVNLASISWSFRGYTTPGHQFASFMLDYKIQVMMLKKVTWPFPIVIITIKALYVDLGFIKVNDLLSVNHCPILMLLVPFQLMLRMHFCLKWLLFFYQKMELHWFQYVNFWLVWDIIAKSKQLPVYLFGSL